MNDKLRSSQHLVKAFVANSANDLPAAVGLKLRMARPKRSSTGAKIRVHYIPEWAKLRGYSQADIVRGTNVDKANVSRWFGGAIPREEQLDLVARFLGLDDPRDLFRDPDDDWLSRFFRDRDEEERERIRRTLEVAFPPKRA